jgi:tRNA pseudouridine32 synthase/23S rRNA pseudouridine746 synthase
LQLPILYEDDALLVIDKPAGIPVHPGSGGGANLEDFLPGIQGDAKMVPQLAHRLDRDTSGCLILGRTKAALRILGRLFEQKRIHKTYWALVAGVPENKQGRIDLPMAKQTQDKRRWHMKVDPEGQPAITDYQVMGSSGNLSWLALRPKTGRTHQLRVHCASQGWPIIGDRFYGEPDDDRHLMLHAASLTIPFEHEKPPIIVHAPPPMHMREDLEKCGWTL